MKVKQLQKKDTEDNNGRVVLSLTVDESRKLFSDLFYKNKRYYPLTDKVMIELKKCILIDDLLQDKVNQGININDDPAIGVSKRNIGNIYNKCIEQEIICICEESGIVSI